jgi:Superinfection immunity protein
LRFESWFLRVVLEEKGVTLVPFGFLVGLLFVAFVLTEHLGMDQSTIIWVAVGFYFVPTIIAWIRGRSPMAVTVVNTTLGWTGVGWFVSLVWSLA